MEILNLVLLMNIAHIGKCDDIHSLRLRLTSMGSMPKSWTVIFLAPLLSSSSSSSSSSLFQCRCRNHAYHYLHHNYDQQAILRPYQHQRRVFETVIINTFTIVTITTVARHRKLLTPSS